MTRTFIRTATVSIAALSLSACMNFGSQGKPWTPEFGQANAPIQQASTYHATQYQAYPSQMSAPHAHPQHAPSMKQPKMRSSQYTYADKNQVQYLSPLPETPAPQTYQSPGYSSQAMSQPHSNQPQHMAQYHSQYSPNIPNPMTQMQPQTPPPAQSYMQQSQMHMTQASAPQQNAIPWGQAMAWMYQGHVKSVMQSQAGEITMILHNGQMAMTQSPQLDDVKRLKQDCGAVCQNMMVTSE